MNGDKSTSSSTTTSRLAPVAPANEAPAPPPEVFARLLFFGRETSDGYVRAASSRADGSVSGGQRAVWVFRDVVASGLGPSASSNIEASPHGDCEAYRWTRTPPRRRNGVIDDAPSTYSTMLLWDAAFFFVSSRAAASSTASPSSTSIARSNSSYRNRTNARRAITSACESESASPRGHRLDAGRHFVPVPSATTRGGASGTASSVTAKPASRVYSPGWGLPFLGSDAYRRSTAEATASAKASANIPRARARPRARKVPKSLLSCRWDAIRAVR